MNPIAIRPMQGKDIDAVVVVENRSFSTPWSRKAFEQEILENDLATYLVVELENQIIAYAGAWIIVDEAHVTNIAVLPEYRGQGIGRALLTALTERVKTAGARSMTLEVRPSNAAALNLYTDMGFVVSGRRNGYYSDTQEDALIMWRHGL